MANTFRLPQQPVSESDPNKKKIITNDKGQAIGEEDPKKKQSTIYKEPVIIGGTSKSSSKSSSSSSKSQSSGPVFTPLPQSQSQAPQQSVLPPSQPVSQIPRLTSQARLVRNEPVFTGAQQSSFTSQSSRQATSQTASTPQTPRVSGTLQASTPEEIRAVRRSRNPFFQAAQGFRAGAELERGKEGLAGAVNPETGFARTTGLIAGNLFTTVGIPKAYRAAGTATRAAGQAIKSTQLAARVTQKASQAKAAIQTTKVGSAVASKAQSVNKLLNLNWGTRLVKDIPIVTSKSVAVVEGTKAAGKLTATSEQKAAMRSVELDQAIRKGFQEESKALGSDGFGIPKTDKQVSWKQLAFQVNPIFSDKKNVYRETVTSELQSQGLFGRELQSGVDAAVRQRKFISGGEAAGLLEISRSSERIGRREVTKVFESAGTKGVSVEKKKLGWDLFKKTFRPISQAGAVEGFSAEVTQQSSREEPLNIKKALGMSTAGAATAGVIGGGIAGLKPNRPGASKVLEIGTWFMDPFEKPGDIAADVTEFGLRKMGRNVPTPTIFTQSSPDSVVSFGVTGTGKKGKTGGFGKPQTQSAAFFTGIPQSQSSGRKGSSALPSLSNDGKFSSPLPVAQPIPFDSIWSNNPVIIPLDTKNKKRGSLPDPVFNPNIVADTIRINKDPVPINENSPVDDKTPTNTNTQTNIFSPVTIPTATPMFRMPPPIPLPFPSFGSGSGGLYGSRTSSKFVNELDASLGVFGSMFSNPLTPGKTMSSYPVLKQPKANKAQAPSSIADALFGSPKKAKKSKRRK